MNRDGAYLLDMLLAAHDEVEFTGRITYSQFENSRLHQNAIFKALEIVGKAASRVSFGMRESQPDIPWREIIGMRNRLVHVYFDVDIGLVWRTVQEDLPALIAQLERIVPPKSTHDH